MIQYLLKHFRYDTMSSWNRSTSYARDVKIHNLDLPRKLRGKAYEFLDLRESYYGINALIAQFERSYDWRWQVGFNGRSAGYLVLYQGGREKSGYTTRCDACGRYTWYETEQPCHMDKCDGTLRLLEEEHYNVISYPGRGVDDETDFSEWSTAELRDRVKLVRDFDRLCDACIKSFIHFVRTHTVEEAEVLVPETRRVAVRTRT
jgi:hypothetical protein